MRIVVALLVVLSAGCIGDVTSAGGSPDAGTADSAGPTVDGPTADSLLKQWSGCMSLDNFKTANMALAWGTLNTTTNQQCANCHSLGGQGFMASQDETVFFTTISTQSAYLVQYFTADVANNAVIVNNASFQAAGVSLTDHPHFDPTNNAGMRALVQFTTLTVAAKAAGTCGPPTLLN